MLGAFMLFCMHSRLFGRFFLARFGAIEKCLFWHAYKIEWDIPRSVHLKDSPPQISRFFCCFSCKNSSVQQHRLQALSIYTMFSVDTRYERITEKNGAHTNTVFRMKKPACCENFLLVWMHFSISIQLKWNRMHVKFPCKCILYLQIVFKRFQTHTDNATK